MKAFHFALAGVLVGCLISTCQGQSEAPIQSDGGGQSEASKLALKECADRSKKCFSDRSLQYMDMNLQIDDVCRDKGNYTAALECQQNVSSTCMDTNVAFNYKLAINYVCDKIEEINVTCTNDVSVFSLGECNLTMFCDDKEVFTKCAMTIYEQCGNKTVTIMEKFYELAITVDCGGEATAEPPGGDGKDGAGTKPPTGGDKGGADKPKKPRDGAAGLIPSLLVQAMAALGVVFMVFM